MKENKEIKKKKKKKKKIQRENNEKQNEDSGTLWYKIQNEHSGTYVPE